ncbi:hypothetical protein JOD69_002050 [Methylocaldum sp. RMAD-M]|jgi:hypothetical protein|nr:hypothetical protein [Methylocaldum sp. RMAD-M]
MTLPIANGLAGSAGHALPEDAVCDWNDGQDKGGLGLRFVLSPADKGLSNLWS